jgi:hypothetical protein
VGAPGGDLIAAGSAADTSGESPLRPSALVVERLRPTGEIDTNFGTDGGYVITSLGPELNAGVRDAMVLPGGRLFLAGQIADPKGGTFGAKIVLAGLEPDGSPASDFGKEGVVITDTVSTIGGRRAQAARTKAVAAGTECDRWADDDSKSRRRRNRRVLRVPRATQIVIAAIPPATEPTPKTAAISAQDPRAAEGILGHRRTEDLEGGEEDRVRGRGGGDADPEPGPRGELRPSFAQILQEGGAGDETHRSGGDPQEERGETHRSGGDPQEERGAHGEGPSVDEERVPG